MAARTLCMRKLFATFRVDCVMLFSYSESVQTNIYPKYVYGHMGTRPWIFEPPLLYPHPGRKSGVLPPVPLLSLVSFFLLPIFFLILPGLFLSPLRFFP